MDQENYNKLLSQKKWKSSLYMQIFTLVFLFAVQLFSSQVFVVKGSSTLEGENHTISDSIILPKEEASKNIIYISSGTQVFISENQKTYTLVKIDDDFSNLEKKNKDFAKVVPKKKQKALENPIKVKVYPEVKKTKFYWPLESSNTTFSVNSKRSQGAVLREHFKVDKIIFSKAFYLYTPHFFSDKKKIAFYENHEIENLWHYSFSARPPPFV